MTSAGSNLGEYRYCEYSQVLLMMGEDLYNYTIQTNGMRFVGLYCIIILQYMLRKHKTD